MKIIFENKRFQSVVINEQKSRFSFQIILFPKITKSFSIIGLFAILILMMVKKKAKHIFINNIHLAVNMDNKYLYPCIVYFTSLLNNKRNTSFYTIHVLTNNNLSNESKIKISQIVERFGNNSVKLNYYNLEGHYTGATAGYISVATYYKISLPSLLPNVDKIIYTDSDMINLEDLSELNTIEFRNRSYFIGVTDYIDHLRQLRSNGLTSDKYINIGVLLMNLKAMREDSIEKKLTDFVATHNLEFYDQTAINCVAYKNIQVLPHKFNVFAFPEFSKLVELNNQQDIKYKVNESELFKAYNEPTFFHYLSIDKPWLHITTKFNRVYLWYYAKMSGFYQEILDYYKFNINEIEELLKQIPEDGGLLKRNYKKLN